MKMDLRIWVSVSVATGLLFLSCSKSAGTRMVRKSLGKLTGSPKDPPVELKMKWNPENRYLMRMELTRRVQRPQRGQTQLAQHEFSFSQDYALTMTNAEPEGDQGLDLEILSLETSTTVGDNLKVSFDSDSGGETATGDPMNEALRQSIGSHLHYVLGQNGKVTKLSGAKELLQRAGASNATASATLRRVYNPEYFKEILELCTLPEKEVKVGEKWPFERDATIGSGAPLLADGTCTFQGWQDHDHHKCAVIEIDGQLQPQVKTPRRPRVSINQVSLMGVDQTGKSSTNQTSQSFAPMVAPNPGIEDGKIAGTIWFDPELGFPVETSLEESYSIKVTVASRQNQTNAQPRSYTSPVNQQLSFKLVQA